jgi:hypothetical protein
MEAVPDAAKQIGWIVWAPAEVMASCFLYAFSLVCRTNDIPMDTKAIGLFFLGLLRPFGNTEKKYLRQVFTYRLKILNKNVNWASQGILCGHIPVLLVLALWKF